VTPFRFKDSVSHGGVELSQAQTEVSEDDGQAGDQAAEGLWAG